MAMAYPYLFIFTLIALTKNAPAIFAFLSLTSPFSHLRKLHTTLQFYGFLFQSFLPIGRRQDIFQFWTRKVTYAILRSLAKLIMDKICIKPVFSSNFSRVRRNYI